MVPEGPWGRSKRCAHLPPRLMTATVHPPPFIKTDQEFRRTDRGPCNPCRSRVFQNGRYWRENALPVQAGSERRKSAAPQSQRGGPLSGADLRPHRPAFSCPGHGAWAPRAKIPPDWEEQLQRCHVRFSWCLRIIRAPLCGSLPPSAALLSAPHSRALARPPYQDLIVTLPVFLQT